MLRITQRILGTVRNRKTHISGCQKSHPLKRQISVFFGFSSYVPGNELFAEALIAKLIPALWCSVAFTHVPLPDAFNGGKRNQRQRRLSAGVKGYQLPVEHPVRTCISILPIAGEGAGLQHVLVEVMLQNQITQIQRLGRRGIRGPCPVVRVDTFAGCRIQLNTRVLMEVNEQALQVFAVFFPFQLAEENI